MVLKFFVLLLFFSSFSFSISIAPTNFDLRSLAILISQECNKNIIISKDVKSLNADYFISNDLTCEQLFDSYKYVIESKNLFLNKYDNFFVVEKNKKIVPVKKNMSNVLLSMILVESINDNTKTEGFKSLFNSVFNNTVSLKDLSTLSFDSVLSIKFNNFLNLASEKGYIKILSKPKVLVSNGKTTTLSVGDTVTVLTSSVSSDKNSDTVRNTYQQKDVGLTIKVTPNILKNGKVSLNTSLILEVLKNYDKGFISTVKREINSQFFINKNGGVFIGGLLSEQSVNNTVKVPLLGDIPVLKYLFSYSSNHLVKKNLSIFISIKVYK